MGQDGLPGVVVRMGVGAPVEGPRGAGEKESIHLAAVSEGCSERGGGRGRNAA